MKKRIEYDFSAVTVLYLTVVSTTNGHAKFYENGKVILSATQGSPASTAFTYDPNATYRLEIYIDTGSGGILFEKDGRINIGIYGVSGSPNWKCDIGHHWVIYSWSAENPEPRYLERLTQLSTNTSIVTASSNKSL